MTLKYGILFLIGIGSEGINVFGMMGGAWGSMRRWVGVKLDLIGLDAVLIHGGRQSWTDKACVVACSPYSGSTYAYVGVLSKNRAMVILCRAKTRVLHSPDGTFRRLLLDHPSNSLRPGLATGVKVADLIVK